MRKWARMNWAEKLLLVAFGLEALGVVVGLATGLMRL